MKKFQKSSKESLKNYRKNLAEIHFLADFRIILINNAISNFAEKSHVTLLSRNSIFKIFQTFELFRCSNFVNSIWYTLNLITKLVKNINFEFGKLG